MVGYTDVKCRQNRKSKMAEKKKSRRRKEEYVAPGEEIVDKPAKEEYKIAKWLRKNVPIKRTKFLNHNVEYFTASKAIDGLMESEWCKSADPFFKSREDAVKFLQVMLEHKFFHRALKVPVSEQELKGRKKDKKSVESSDEKKKEEKDKKDKATENEGNAETKEVTDKKKRKIRLEMHNDQRFVDGLNAYVWIYDPIPFHYWIIGTLLVLGAIGVCLFPLWPPSIRLGVYYLSVAAAGFLVCIIILAVLRLVFFCLVWIVTMGKHHIWILPNLTEDVGFFASFWPLYTYEYKGDIKDGLNKKNKKQKKDKNSDAEDEPDNKDVKGETSPPSTPRKEKRKDPNPVEEDRSSENGNENGNQVENVGASESESESSQRSSTGKDFEMLDKAELDS